MSNNLRPLGNSDLLVSAVGLGGNNFSHPNTPTSDQRESTRVIHAAIDAGITFIDTAELYGSEPGMSEVFVGKALEGHRHDVVLASKWGYTSDRGPDLEDTGPRGSRTYIRRAVEGSLRRLRTDYIDLYQFHAPDPEVPIAETLEALSELVQEGKVRYVGHSNFTAEQLIEADDVATSRGLVRFVSAQNEYSLLNRDVEEDLLPAVNERGLGLIPYFPLFNGLLTGKYTRDGGEGRLTRIKPQILETVDWDQLAAYSDVARRLDAPESVVSIAWLLAQTGVATVIAGATTPEQVRQNAAASAVELPADALAEINEIFA